MWLVLTMMLIGTSFPMLVLRQTATVPSFSMTVYSETSNSIIKAVGFREYISMKFQIMREVLLSSSIIEMTVVSGLPISIPLGTDVILAVKFSTPSLS